MVVFTRGKSRAINSPRYLALRHARRSARQYRVAHDILEPEEEPKETHLAPGQEKLNSYWAPGLQAGDDHNIVATQLVKDPTHKNSLQLISKQDFFVDAPQFTLPLGSVYSVYPPHGYSDDHRILPHVVLSDPHLPWERSGSPISEKGLHRDKRNKVPWLALFTFTSEELKLAETALGGKSHKQTSTLAVTLAVKELRAIPNVVSPITDQMGLHVNDASGDFIFLQPELFKNLFSGFDGQNKRNESGGPETTHYKYLSHVREINTTGMAVAGVEEVGIFSIVVGSRSGPLDNVTPMSVFVHLVSIEGVEEMGSFPTDGFVALCSLHSWSYVVMPPGMVNIHEAFNNIGKTLGVLRPPDTVLNSVRSSGKVRERIVARLRDGYSMVRYRMQTGEQTVALYRGPLTPTVVGQTGTLAKVSSNTGQDLQILDREVGIMDISYSVAWTLGRTLALGNQAFAAALYRLRAAIHAQAMKALKISVVLSTGGQDSYRSRADVLSGLKETVKNLGNIHLGVSGYTSSPCFQPSPPGKCWKRPRLDQRGYPPLHYNADNIKSNYLEEAKKAALQLARAMDGSLYDETNTPVSTDWMIVLAFVLDRMFLSGVPAHYLISDPTHVPPESLRFFYIDPNWVDAMIDGVLSLANHLGEDRDRVAIKFAINAYLAHHPEHEPEYTPQVPRYGFYLRSDLVSMFPDLKVDIKPGPPTSQAPLLRHEIVTDGVMMGLVDRQPGLPEFNSMVFTQPPHQQRFAAARKLNREAIYIDVRKQYTITVSPEDRQRDALKPEVKMKPTDPDNWFVWSKEAGSGTDDVRLLRLPHYGEQQLKLLRAWSDEEVRKGHQRPFDDDTPNSALLAMQLNDPIYSLTIELGRGINALASPAWNTLESPKEPCALTSMIPSRITQLTKPKKVGVEGRRDATAGAVSKPNNPPTSSDFTGHEGYGFQPCVSTSTLDTRGRAIPPYSPRRSLSPAVLGDRPHMAGLPKYQCRVYSRGNGSNEVITTGDNAPQDLIFRIRVEDNDPSDYKLMELAIVILFGRSKPDIHRLMAGYDGSGARMLSNLRFNVLPTLDKRDEGSCLVLRIMPRSRKEYARIDKVDDLSFILCLAQVNKFTRTSKQGSKTLVNLKTEATYQGVRGVASSSITVSVINHDVGSARGVMKD